MIPYLTIRNNVHNALFASIGVTIILLLVVGFSQAIALRLVYKRAILHASRAVFIGGAAAGTSYGLIRAINQGEGAL
jgi:VIT1/CCC1 family predicted Fe2+/Mn2+ transporter